MDLPQPLNEAVRPLFDALPLESAMEQLVVSRRPSPDLVGLVESVVARDVVLERPPLVAALWLYIDEIDRSHAVSQGLGDATGAFWHGIMHRREGDFSNSHYWFRRVGNHPALARLDYDPHQFIDEVERHHRTAPTNLVDMQRREWAELFAWCAEQ